MESEGLYRYEHRDEQKAFVVVGPGRENMGGTYTKNEASIAARLANLAYAEGRKGRDRLLEALKEAHHAISILPQEVRFHYEIRCLTLIEDVLRIEKSEGSKDGK